MLPSRPNQCGGRASGKRARNRSKAQRAIDFCLRVSATVAMQRPRRREKENRKPEEKCQAARYRAARGHWDGYSADASAAGLARDDAAAHGAADYPGSPQMTGPNRSVKRSVAKNPYRSFHVRSRLTAGQPSLVRAATASLPSMPTLRCAPSKVLLPVY
jgi:hypothetical protein